MIFRLSSRTEMIRESEQELETIKRQIANGFLEGMGYTKEQMQNLLNLAEKDLALTKKEISFPEYFEAYKKVYSKERSSLNG